MNGTSATDAPPPALVTGGAGFIGSHLVRLLLDRGHAVRVIDLERSAGLDPRAEFIQGSVLDDGTLRQAADGAAWVFHLAANPNLWAADKDSFFLINHQATRLVIEAAVACGARRIVCTSTESILVSRKSRSKALVDESVPRGLDDMCGVYCQSKLLGEREALDAARRGAPVVVVNPTMPVGPGDHRLTPPTRMLMDFLNGRYPAYLDFAMNLVDVRDAALGHLLAAEKGQVGERYILGGENLRLSDILAILGGLTGLAMPQVKIPYAAALAVAAVSEFVADHITRRPPNATVTGVRLAGAELRVDNARAIRELGFAPSPARDAIADAVAWMLTEGMITRPLPNDAVIRRDAA